jgi:glucose/mannose-6-phosphate isomerase
MDSYLKGVLTFTEQLGYKGLLPERLGALKNIQADGIIMTGMGGSALASEMLQHVRKEVGLALPVVVWRDYGLPDSSDYGFKKPLIIFVSFSGNTEETVSGLTEALRRPRNYAGLAVIATGGALKDMAEKAHLPFVGFPALDLQPRQATGRMFYSLIEILFAAGLVAKRAPAFTRLSPLALKASGKALAKKIHRHLAVIYTDEAARDLGYFWKIRINETGKTQAFSNVVPEMNHNELVGYELPIAKTAALFLHEPLTGRMAKRVAINKTLLKKRGVRVIDLPFRGKTWLERSWNSIMLADWTSYFLAELQGVDAGPVPIVEKLKDLMRK